MRVPVSWLRELVDVPAEVDAVDLADRLTLLGLKLESLESPGAEVSGPLVVGRVLEFSAETHSNGKTIRWCSVDVGEDEPRGIVCGAANFAVGDLVVVALPGTVLPGGFAITARKTYGHVSDGMICSVRELGIGDDHAGILVLGPNEAAPGDPAGDLLGLRDQVIELEINPDRAYALSMRGVARDVAVGCGVAFADPVASLPAALAGDGYPVRIDDPSGCDRFVALQVCGVDPTAPTPRWMAHRLRLAGMRPISLAVDVTNYVMIELGNPIHGYDLGALRGSVVVRRARPGETLTTLDGVERRLDPEDLLIADDRGPIGLAGVMGGAETEIGPDTRDLLIEAAHFDPVSIARTAKRHKLPSEASRRFERGVDPAVAPVAARRVADLLARLGGGSVAQTATVAGVVPQPRAAVVVDESLASRVAGFPIDESDVVRALELVGCEVSRSGSRLRVVPPTWRQDMRDPNDLVEEVVRVVGYDKVPSVLPAAPSGRGLTREQRHRRLAVDTLVGAGYVETICYPFVGVEDADALGLPADDPCRRALRLLNPLSEQLPLLRTSLLPGLLRAIVRNASRGQSDVGLFEIGSVFRPDGAEPAPPALGVDRAPNASELAALEAGIPAQPLHVAVVACGDRAPGSWWGAADPYTWADAVETARLLARCLHVALTVSAAEQAPWHPGRCAALSVGSTLVGHAGELHPEACAAWGAPTRTVATELDLGALLAAAPPSVPAPHLSTYPVGKEDVALVVRDAVAAADVADALTDGAGSLLESVRLFDVYAGEQLPSDHKSLAFALRFRAPDRTLTEAEIGAARDAAVAEAARRHGAVQRV